LLLSFSIDSRSFVVLDAESTTVTRALAILGASRFAWAVVQSEQLFYTFLGTELRPLLEKAGPSELLINALKLSTRLPSLVVGRRDAVVTLKTLPVAGTPENRAVVARKDINGLYRISAVGTLRKPTKTDGAKRRLTAGRGWRGRAPAKNAAAKKAPARKAAKKAAPERRRIFGHEPLSFGFAGPRRQPAPEVKTEAVKDFETVDVFYATEREQKASSDRSGIVTFLNQLPERISLNYGICSVTVPANHKLGKIETPSIWTLRINKAKHFTISACSPRTKGQFFDDLTERIGRSEDGSCFVFIHGYNVSFEDAAMRTAQLTKDLKFDGVPILYSWASAYRLDRYHQDEETVLLTIKRLTLFLQDLTAVQGAREIHLIAHSMGNRALIGALERLTLTANTARKPFKQIVLTAPDVPRKDVEPLIEATSLRAERVTLYASRKDKALGISKAKHKYERLGKVYGYPYVLPVWIASTRAM